jgi:multidrug efflux pump
MAVAVIFGLGVATMLTLVVVPVLYSLSETVRLPAWLRRRIAIPES